MKTVEKVPAKRTCCYTIQLARLSANNADMQGRHVTMTVVLVNAATVWMHHVVIIEKHICHCDIPGTDARVASTHPGWL